MCVCVCVRLQSSDVLTEHVFQRPHPTIEEKLVMSCDSHVIK